MSENVKRLRRQRRELDRHIHDVSVAEPRTYEDGVADAAAAIEGRLKHLLGNSKLLIEYEPIANMSQWEWLNRQLADALTACLPPPEPEVVVTEEMAQRGSLVLEEYHFLMEDMVGPSDVRFADIAGKVYRAMHPLEPKQDSTRDDQ